ncbi:MAG: UPF0164 family protein [FCB group bacterium]|nr:UPF0164 family protein [FCB group bacterium]
MKTVKFVILIWALAAIIAGFFGEVTVAGEYGATTAGFLKIGVGARAAGVGDAYTAIADDASAIYWNAAGISRLDSRQMQFSHYSWYQDIKVENFFAVFPGQRISFGAGITYLDYGDFQSYDVDGDPGDQLSMYNLVAAFSAAGNINETFSIGVTAKYIEQSFDIVKGSAFAGDIGLMAEFDKLRFGLAAVNFGSKMKFIQQEDELPAAIRVGVSLREFGDRALFTIEAHAPIKGRLTLHQGVEFKINDQLYARTGAVYRTNTLQDMNALSFNLGAGLVYGVGRFDYTFIPSDEYGSQAVHNLTLSVGW